MTDFIDSWQDLSLLTAKIDWTHFEGEFDKLYSLMDQSGTHPLFGGPPNSSRGSMIWETRSCQCPGGES